MSIEPVDRPELKRMRSEIAELWLFFAYNGPFQNHSGLAFLSISNGPIRPRRDSA